jgi:hypothetical protein
MKVDRWYVINKIFNDNYFSYYFFIILLLFYYYLLIYLYFYLLYNLSNINQTLYSISIN